MSSNLKEIPNEVGEAICAVQDAASDPRKSGENPHFKSSYATLSDVLGVLRPVLEDKGLRIIQYPGVIENGAYCLVTTLRHLSGNDFTLTSPLPTKDMGDPQKLGSAITYLRRYVLLSLFGLVPTDDDGNSAAINELEQRKLELRAKIAAWMGVRDGKDVNRSVVKVAVASGLEWPDGHVMTLDECEAVEQFVDESRQADVTYFDAIKVNNE